jgi:hypothetical protein
MQWLAARGAGYTAILSDILKYLNHGWWREAFRSSLSAAVAAAAEDGAEGGVAVLDVGSGTGTLAVWAAQAGASVVQSCERERWASLMASATVGLSGASQAVTVEHHPGGCEDSRALRRPHVLVHDILGTPARMGQVPALHETQRVLDKILRAPWRAGGERPLRSVITVPASVRVYLQVAHSPIGASYVTVPSTVLGRNVSAWHALAVPEANRLEHTASQVPRWPLTQRRLITHWDFMDPPYRDADSPQGPAQALRMPETWEQDFNLTVLQTGLAHMIVISREFEFVGGPVYSDTTSRADVEEARETEGLPGGCGWRDGRQGGDTIWEEGREAREKSPPEVGQLMFVGPATLIKRGGTVHVRVRHGAEGFRAALLPL